MVQDTVTNVWAVYRYALGYPDEARLEALREICVDLPSSLEDLRAQYIELFEAGLPQPRCPLLESYYLLNRPAGDVVLENKLFYQHFGLKVEMKAAPDHLLTQLEFLSWLDHCLQSGNPDPASLETARREFVARHLAHWIPRAAESLTNQGAGCYAELLASLAAQVEEASGDPS
jgi:DMSO reductase family type II enzyme chaperone